jgi:hypothetical protein
MGNALVFFVIVFVVFLVVAVGMIALFVGLFFFIYRTNTSRSRVAVDDALDRWAAEEGYEILSSKQVGRGADHPFRDRFGFGIRKHGDYGGVVLRIEVEDHKGRERSGWLFIPLKGKGGVQLGGHAVYPDWQNAEVVWDRH